MGINWDALGALAETLGALAVILSVLYLAVQIRTQTREARLSATRTLSMETRDLMEKIALDHEFSKIYQEGMYDYLSLPDNERMRVSYMFQSFLRICEQRYLHSQHGAIDSIYRESSERAYRLFFRSPGVQDFWAVSKDTFEDGFIAYVEKLIREANAMEFTSTFTRINQRRQDDGSDKVTDRQVSGSNDTAPD